MEGVKDGKQYTIPVEAALEAVRNGEDPELTTRQKHTRECFVVLEEGADAKKVDEEIKTMPNYFSDYDTTVHFISEEELKANHSGIPHGGFVLRSGKTAWDGEVLGTVQIVISKVWEKYEIQAQIPDGKQAIYFTYRGYGNLDLLSFTLE